MRLRRRREICPKGGQDQPQFRSFDKGLLTKGEINRGKAGFDLRKGSVLSVPARPF
jgi:hypothetical protein